MIYNVISIMALICSLAGNVFINYKKKIGFIIWTISNILWIIINLMKEPNYSQIIMFIVYIAFNIHGYINWRKSNA